MPQWWCQHHLSSANTNTTAVAPPMPQQCNYHKCSTNVTAAAPMPQQQCQYHSSSINTTAAMQTPQQHRQHHSSSIITIATMSHQQPQHHSSAKPQQLPHSQSQIYQVHTSCFWNTLTKSMRTNDSPTKSHYKTTHVLFWSQIMDMCWFHVSVQF